MNERGRRNIGENWGAEGHVRIGDEVTRKEIGGAVQKESSQGKQNAICSEAEKRQL